MQFAMATPRAVVESGVSVGKVTVIVVLFDAVKKPVEASIGPADVVPVNGFGWSEMIQSMD